MTSRAATVWDVIRWDILGTIAFRVLLFAGVFFAAAWVAMVFWGVLFAGVFFAAAWVAMVFWGVFAERTALSTISYDTAALGVVGLWLAVGPIAWLVAFRVKKGSVIEF